MTLERSGAADHSIFSALLLFCALHRLPQAWGTTPRIRALQNTDYTRELPPAKWGFGQVSEAI
jgi:hypothetical protein